MIRRIFQVKKNIPLFFFILIFFSLFFRLENRTLATLRLDELACLPQVEPAALVIDSVAGANVSLRCSVFGLPSASVSWWHSNRLVANGSELQHAWEDQYYSIAEYRTNEHQVSFLAPKFKVRMSPT